MSAAAALALTLGACAGEPLQARDVDEWLLTQEDKERLIASSSEPGAVATIAEFFEAVQHRNPPAAYAHFGRELREDLSFNRFSNAMTFSESGFRSKPVVDRIEYGRGYVHVHLRLAFGDVRTPEDPQEITFVMDEQDGRWVITKDPELRLGDRTGPFEPVDPSVRPSPFLRDAP